MLTLKYFKELFDFPEMVYYFKRALIEWGKPYFILCFKQQFLYFDQKCRLIFKDLNSDFEIFRV